MSLEAIPSPKSAKRGVFSSPNASVFSENLGPHEAPSVPRDERKPRLKNIKRNKPPAPQAPSRRRKSVEVAASGSLGPRTDQCLGLRPQKCGESVSPRYETEASARFPKFGSDGLLDEDLLEHILSHAQGDFDVKRLAKGLIAEFGSFAEVVAARPGKLQKIAGLDLKVIFEIKMIEAAARRMAKSAIEKRPALGNLGAVIDYCRTAMAFLDHEEFRVLFLDKKNMLIADEVHGRGTVDQAAVYPREIIRRALELSASAIILAHNHPSGNPEPSTDDIYLTHQIIAVAKLINVEIHDHIIIGRHGHISFKNRQMI